MPAFDPPLTAQEVSALFPKRYNEIATVKSGGQGAVFKATVTQDDSKAAGAVVALKVYFADALEERTKREVAALRRLASESIVRLRGNGRVVVRGVGCIWLETDYIQGTCLVDLIASGPLPLKGICHILCDVSDAIEQMWTHRIVHRDIKPDNLIVRPNGRVVVIDLGIARHVELNPLTTAGKAWGTQGYYSPEQLATPQSLTLKSDIFALGIVAQEALMGRHPTGRQQQALVQGGIRTASLGVSLPSGVADLLDRMLSADPVRRPLPIQIRAIAATYL